MDWETIIGQLQQWTANDIEEPDKWKRWTCLLTEYFNCYYDVADRNHVIHLLESPNTTNKLVELMQVTRDPDVKANILAIFKVMSSDKKGHHNGALGKSKLLSSLMDMTSSFLELTPSCRLLLLDVLGQYFRNKNNSLKACRSSVVGNLLALLDLRERLVHKRRHRLCKSVAVGLWAISKHRRGRQVISPDHLDRLYEFLVRTPDEKSFDSVLHKMGSVIIRCSRRRELPLPRLPSALHYEPFDGGADDETPPAASDAASDRSGGEGGSSGADSDDGESDSECRPDGAESPDVMKEESDPLVNVWRHADQLAEYRYMFDMGDDDELDRLLMSVPTDWWRHQVYQYLAERTRSLHRFRLIPYPDWMNASANEFQEGLYVKSRQACRSKLLNNLKLALYSRTDIELVFDLDEKLLYESFADQPLEMTDLTQIEEALSFRDELDETLRFESRFECGNLRRVYKVGPREYDLILNADVNATGRQQWFYFRVSNTRADETYTFNIINMEKGKSLFNKGMQPVMCSVRRGRATGHPTWERSGTDICYYRNVYRNRAESNINSTAASQKKKKVKSYMTLSFSITFPYSYDVCYLAYHYPYTYTQLLTDTAMWCRQVRQQVAQDADDVERRRQFRVTTLCHSPCGNAIPLLLIGCHGDDPVDHLSKSKLSVLTSRVHPCESNASYVMRGLISAALNVKSSGRTSRHSPGNQSRAESSPAASLASFSPDQSHAEEPQEQPEPQEPQEPQEPPTEAPPAATNGVPARLLVLVPMLNVDGVINGCSRSELSNEDLNRRWLQPHPQRHPSIYHAKGLLEYLIRVVGNRPRMLLDIHGHSRNMNVFIYGCSRTHSWLAEDQQRAAADPDAEPCAAQRLAEMLNGDMVALDLDQCSWEVEENRETTARVVGWRHLAIANSSTLECSLAGSSKYPQQGLQFNIENYFRVGASLYRTVSTIE